MAEVSYLQLHENGDDEHDHHSILFDRQNQVNFVIDMFHQSVEQSQSRLGDFRDPDLNSRLWNEGTDADDLGVLGLGLGFHLRDNADDHLGFMFSDYSDDFIPGTAALMADPSNRSGYFSGGFTVPVLESDSDLNWEQIDDLEPLNLESNPNFADYGFTDHGMLFGEFLDNDSSSTGGPPASMKVIENLVSVVITDEDFERQNAHCAVCKDEIGVGLTAKQLPCDHVYHGDCIGRWLAIRNTCPVCRHELVTDDVNYERMKAERDGGDY